MTPCITQELARELYASIQGTLLQLFTATARRVASRRPLVLYLRQAVGVHYPAMGDTVAMPGLDALHELLMGEVDELGKTLHHGSSSKDPLVRMHLDCATQAMLDLAADLVHYQALASDAGESRPVKRRKVSSALHALREHCHDRVGSLAWLYLLHALARKWPHDVAADCSEWARGLISRLRDTPADRADTAAWLARCLCVLAATAHQPSTADQAMWDEALQACARLVRDVVRTSVAKSVVQLAVDWQFDLMRLLLQRPLVPTTTVQPMRDTLLILLASAAFAPTPSALRLLLILLGRCVVLHVVPAGGADS